MLAIKNKALGGRVVFNFLASDLQNAKEVWQAAEGAVLFGIRVSDYSSINQLSNIASVFKREFGLVSLVLGDGDPNQWKWITEAALAINPGHINQVFPALGYTIGSLASRGILDQNTVNALVSFSGTEGIVDISTGVISRNNKERAAVPIGAALRMIKEVGGRSLKILPLNNEKRLREFDAVIAETTREKIDIIEPTGGISIENIAKIISISLKNRDSLIIPHIHNAMLGPDRRTDPVKVRIIIDLTKKVLGV